MADSAQVVPERHDASSVPVAEVHRDSAPERHSETLSDDDTLPMSTVSVPSTTKRSSKKASAAGNPSVSERLVHKRRRGTRRKTKRRLAFVVGYIAAAAALFWFVQQIYHALEAWK